MVPVSRPCAVRHAYLAANADALANDMRGAIQNFGQIAARLLLHQHGCHQKTQIFGWHTVCHLQQRIAQRKSEILLAEDDIEFRGHAGAGLLRQHLNGGAERMARAQGSRHQINRVRKPLVE